MRAISLDNLFCFKSPTYQAAIGSYYLAMDSKIDKKRKQEYGQNQTQTYSKKLNEIVDRLQSLVKHQQSVQPIKSEKYREMAVLITDIHNIKINYEKNKNPIYNEELKNIIRNTKQVLGKHLGTVLTQFYKPNSLKVCEPELERLEKEVENLNQYYTGPLY